MNPSIPGGHCGGEANPTLVHGRGQGRGGDPELARQHRGRASSSIRASISTGKALVAEVILTDVGSRRFPREERQSYLSLSGSRTGRSGAGVKVARRAPAEPTRSDLEACEAEGICLQTVVVEGKRLENMLFSGKASGGFVSRLSHEFRVLFDFKAP